MTAHEARVEAVEAWITNDKWRLAMAKNSLRAVGGDEAVKKLEADYKTFCHLRPRPKKEPAA